MRALDSAPGVRSARYAGEDATDEQNLRKLLDEMRGKEDREAAYVCAIAFVEPDGTSTGSSTAAARGALIDEPRGSGGFGYDPVFVPAELDGDERTMAELSQEEKDEISHRARAMRKLIKYLPAGPVSGEPGRRAGASGHRRVLNTPLIAPDAVTGLDEVRCGARCRSSPTRS